MVREQTKVILVTDGDDVALKAVEKAVENLGLRCISASAGNPTRLTGYELVELIKTAKYDPVVVMLDDRGDSGRGKGEKAAEIIARDPKIKIIGAVAVASNTTEALGTRVDCCITWRGERTNQSVDKNGELIEGTSKLIQGDTVDILEGLDIPYIVGIGDPGKMTNGADNPAIGAPITTMALREILNRSGITHGRTANQ